VHAVSPLMASGFADMTRMEAEMATQEEKIMHARALLKIEVLRDENKKFRALLEQVVKETRPSIDLRLDIKAALAGR